MRAGIILSLVVVGGIVVITPIVAEYRLKAEHQASVARLLEKGSSSVSLLEENLSGPLQFGCWFTGTVMAVAGIVLVIREQQARIPGRIDHPQSSLATDDRPRRTEPGSGHVGVQPRSGL